MIQFVSRSDTGEYEHSCSRAWAYSHCKWIADQLQTEVVETPSLEIKKGRVAIVGESFDSAFFHSALVQCLSVGAFPALFLRSGRSLRAFAPSIRSLKLPHAICTPATHCWRLWDEEWLAMDRDSFFQADWKVEPIRPIYNAVYVGLRNTLSLRTRLGLLRYPELVLSGSKFVIDRMYEEVYTDIGLEWKDQWRYFAEGKVVLVISDDCDDYCMNCDARIWHAWQAGRPVAWNRKLWKNREDIWKRWENGNGQVANRKRAFTPWEEIFKWTIKSAGDLHTLVRSLPDDPHELKVIAETQRQTFAHLYFTHNRRENRLVEFFACV